MSVRSIFEKRCAKTLLTGSVLPEGTRFVDIEVARFYESPDGFSAPVIFVLKEAVCGKTEWAANRSNLEIIFRLFGDDDNSLIGKRIKLEVIMVRNPKTKELVRSLAVCPNQ
jgi:hypothetical protein